MITACAVQGLLTVEAISPPEKKPTMQMEEESHLLPGAPSSSYSCSCKPIVLFVPCVILFEAEELLHKGYRGLKEALQPIEERSEQMEAVHCPGRCVEPTLVSRPGQGSGSAVTHHGACYICLVADLNVKPNSSSTAAFGW